MTVNILGVPYTIIESDRVKDMNLNHADGYCDSSTKKIVIDTFRDEPGSLEDLESYKKKVIRHEIIHAFLFESGLGCESWAANEEIVDWIAYQFPKLLDTFESLGIERW